MKKLIPIKLTLTLVLIIINLNFSKAQPIKLGVQDYSIKLPEGQVNFRIDESKIALKFKNNTSLEIIQQFLNSQNLFENFDSSWYVPFPKGIMIAKIKEQKKSINYLQKLEEIQQNEIIEFSVPVLTYNENTQEALYNLFYVKLLNGKGYDLLKKYSLDLNFEIEKEYEKDIYFCRINKQSKGNAFEIAKFLQNLQIFEFAEPDFIYWGQLNINDTYYNQQWALNNTGSQFSGAVSGADIDIVNAWGISTGSSSIKVAILDCFGSSSQFSHSDISFYSTYDATGNGFSSSGYQSDAHGIACGGVIAASTNNSKGIAGIAYNSKVIAVKIGTITNSSGNWNSTGNSISDGINWAYQNADVISNSNSIGSSSSLIDNAISNSINKGRSNKGTPFLSSSGNNSSTTIRYPSSNTNSIAVGASNVDDSRASFSDYGNGLDIGAPGVNVYSTDISGSAGFASGDYFLFNGTSAACPIAASVMALILSGNSSLSYSSARSILESTCEKVGGYTYNSNVSGQPNGTWSSSLGYGRINAYKALLKATKPDLIITSSTQSVSPTTVAAGSNVTFSCSENNAGYVSSTSNAVTIWLSPSKTLITSNSVYLGQISNFPALSANSNSSALNASLKIPTNTCAGTYYVFFWADGNQVVSESDEANNFVYLPITITSSSPTTQASSITFSNISTNQMNIKWTNGNGTRRVVYINTTNTFTPPSDGTNPSSNSTYGGSGQEAVYNGASNSVTVFGLSPNTTYYFRVYEAKCAGTSSLYQTSTASNNPNNQITSSSCTVPSTQSSNIYFSNLSTNQMTINWSIGSGTRSVVYLNTTNNFTPPSNGTSPSANTTYSGSGQQPIYNNSANSVTVSGLKPNTTYYLRIYEANCSGTNSMYQTSTASNNPNSQNTLSSCTAPSTQASNISFSGTGINQVTVNWNSGNGSRRVVCINTSNSFSQPSNGTDPSANTTYVGSGSQVIYNGTGNTETVSGLSSGTTYYFRVYEANCAGSSSQYQTSSNSGNPNSQNTSTGGTCTTPQTPTPSMGTTNCPGPGIWGTGTNLWWSNSGTGINYDYVLIEYPYEPSNIVFTGNCISTWTAFISGLTEGKLYQWNVRSTADCNSCNSPWSEPNYFQVAPIINEGSSIYVCNGTGTTLTTPTISVPSPGTVSYQWYKWIGGKLSPVGTNSASYFVSTTGTYCIKLIYSGSNICSGTDTSVQSLFTYVSVASIPSAPVLSTNSPVCQGNTLTLTATAQSNSSYFWSGPNGYISNNDNIYIQSVDTQSSGIYSCYIVNQGCQSQTANLNALINLAPSASFTYIKAGNKVTFTNDSKNATSYLWDFGDGQTSNQLSPSHTYSTNKNFNVCLTANKNSCNSSSNCQLISLGSETKIKTQPTFAKLFRDTASTHKYWNAYDVIQSSVDSGYICIGWYQNTANNSNNGIQYFKLDKNGNLLWIRGLPEYSNANATKIVRSQNGYLITLNYNKTTVMEIDEQGNKLWAKELYNYTHDTISGLDYKFGISDFIKTSDNGFIGIGSYNYTHYIDKYGTPSSTIIRSGVSLVKLDKSGNLSWQKQHSYNLYSNTSIYTKNIIQDSNGDFYLCGTILDGSAQYPKSNDGLIVKFDSNGAHLWSKYYSSGTNQQDEIISIIINNNSDIIFTGFTRDNSNILNSFITKINSSGTFINSKSLTQTYIARVINSNSSNTNFLIYTPINTFGITTLDSSFNITNQKEFNLKSSNLIKPTLDNKFISVSGQYPFNANSNDYRYGIFKIGFTDTSCIDTSNSSYSLNSLSFSLSTLNVSSASLSVSISNFVTSPIVSSIRDTSICYQPPLCSFATSDSSKSFGGLGGKHFVNVTTSNSTCTWSIINLNSWIHVLPTTLQTGNGVITITVDSCANTSPRSATIIVGDIVYSIIQSCSQINQCKPPVAKFTASQTSGNVPFTVDFFDLSSTKGQTSWQWTIYNGTQQPVIRTTQNPTGIQFDNPGSFLVKLLVIDSCGSSDLLVGDFIKANASSGIQNINNYKIKVHPNPTNGLFIIDFDGLSTDKTIFVYDALGKIVREITTSNLKIELDMRGCGEGIYLIRIKNEEGIFNSKLVIE